MINPGLPTDLSLHLLRDEAERRLAPVARRADRRGGVRRRIGRTLLVWGDCLAPGERGGPPTRRLATTMVP